MNTKKALAAMILSIGFFSHANANDYIDEVRLDCGLAQGKHAWREPDIRRTTFHYQLEGCGVAVYKGDFGFRYSYFEGEKVRSTGGYYHYVSVDFEHIEGFELIYRKRWDEVELFGGIGWYNMPTPAYFDNGGGREDSDDDKGYFIGVHYELSDDAGVMYKFTRHSTIGDLEYTDSHGLHFTYKFGL